MSTVLRQTRGDNGAIRAVHGFPWIAQLDWSQQGLRTYMTEAIRSLEREKSEVVAKRSRQRRPGQLAAGQLSGRLSIESEVVGEEGVEPPTRCV